jgi:hypothetical protein
MNTVRFVLVACLSLGGVTLVATTGCAERPGKKKEDKDEKKGDAKKDDAKKDDEKKADDKTDKKDDE